MIARRCSDDASGLLEFYVNGSLARDEAASVRTHVESCPVCGREVDELLEVARAVQRHGGIPATTGRTAQADPRRHRSWAVAAAILLPTIGTLIWFAARRTEAPRPMEAPPQVAQSEADPLIFDLGAGPIREGGAPPVPTLALSPETRQVLFSLIVPVRAGSRLHAEVRDSDGHVLATAASIAPPDLYGRIRFEVAADTVRGPGDHEVVVRREDPSGETRDFRYPFRVEAPSGKEQSDADEPERSR